MRDESEGRKVGTSDGEAPVEAPLPPRLIEAVRAEYHASPAAPKDEIWNRIEAARRSRGVSHSGGAGPEPTFRPSDRPTVRRPWLRYVTGIAALLALGIGIGRLTSRSATSTTTPEVTAAAPNRSGPAYAIATANHLSRVETFLTALRTAPNGEQFGSQARDLLTSTRLLLDSKGTNDPRIRALLEDLELILVQVTTLDGRRSPEELDLITDGLEQREVLPRLRTVIPAGTARQL
ncbi:MAG: hypothetical protein OEW44_06665 [Gemmatimonadota bacterium]|jgi:hypothetical protein|nr:hypothetical protein [Gemmatimonadota bacterium]